MLVEEGNIMAEKMTRRTFMKGAAAAAAAISLSGVLVGCGGGSAAADEVLRPMR